MPIRRLAAPFLVLALLVAACGGDDDGGGPEETQDTTTTDPPADRGAAGVGPNGFVPEPIDWEDCGGLECATLSVPLDYADLDGPQVELAVTRSPATGKRIGPLFVNPGGPGGSAAELVINLPFLFPDSVVERFDLVGVEPRGVQGSVAFDCGADYSEVYGVDPTVEDATDRAALISIAEGLAADCEANAGDVLPHVGTRDVARDMDSVRAAMGDEQMSYYGISYGTAIGQVYADLFPERIRAMVIDAVVELGRPGLELAAEQAAGFELALSRFAEHCRTSRCETADVLAAVEQVQARAEQLDGIPAPTADRPAGPDDVVLGLGQALYADVLWPQLDAALSDALGGDGGGLVELADDYLGIGDFDVYFAVNCIDFAWPSGDPDAFLAAAKAAAAASPHFGEALVTDYLRCVAWPVPPAPLEATDGSGAPPILVISTTGDPATPYEAGVKVADALESGVLLTLDGDGHGAIGSGSACINASIAAYLLDGAVPEPGAVCD